jgi:hypothetical protein
MSLRFILSVIILLSMVACDSGGGELGHRYSREIFIDNKRTRI